MVDAPNVIKASDLKPVSTATVMNKDIDQLNADLSGFQKLADTVLGIMNKVIEARSMMTPQQDQKQVQNFPVSKQVLEASAPTVVEREKIVMKMPEFDANKIKQKLLKAITEDANSLPAEIKKMRIEDLIGDNFKQFKITIAGFQVSADLILERLSIILAKELKSVIKE